MKSLAKKKDIAKYYYLKGELTQSEIAEKVEVSEVTISKWKRDGKWEDYRKSTLVTRPEQLANLYEQLAELNDKIKARPKGERYAESKEADTMAKITASINNLEIEASLKDSIEVFMKFSEWLRAVDLEKAKEFIGLQDAYIKTLS